MFSICISARDLLAVCHQIISKQQPTVSLLFDFVKVLVPQAGLPGNEVEVFGSVCLIAEIMA